MLKMMCDVAGERDLGGLERDSLERKVGEVDLDRDAGGGEWAGWCGVGDCMCACVCE